MSAIVFRPHCVNSVISISSIKLIPLFHAPSKTHSKHFYQTPNVVTLIKFSSLAVREVVKLTTSCAAGDENFIKMSDISIPVILLQLHNLGWFWWAISMVYGWAIIWPCSLCTWSWSEKSNKAPLYRWIIAQLVGVSSLPLNSFTVSLHSPNGRHLSAVRTV